MARTMFTADTALDSLLASSTPKVPSKPQPKENPPTKPSKPKPITKKPRATVIQPESNQDEPPERQQLNVEVENDLFTALNIRKTHAKLSGNKDEDNYCKIVELALRKHLAREIELACMMKG